MISGLGYIGVGGDIPAWRSFATEVLGAAIADSSNDDVLALRVDDRAARLWVHAGEPEDLLYVGWEVASESELEAFVNRLEENGISVREGTEEEVAERKVNRLVKYTSPDGLETEVYFGASSQLEHPFCSPTGVSGFVTDDLGLGHLGISVTEIEVATDYYTKVLGFRVSDYIDFNFGPEPTRVTFLHCNPRHHTLALVPAELPKRLHHLMIEVEKLDDVGSAYEAVQAQNVPVIGSLGRHTNDHMVSFYMACPSGFGIEYGWDGRLIDDQEWTVEVYKSASLWGHQGLG